MKTARAELAVCPLNPLVDLSVSVSAEENFSAVTSISFYTDSTSTFSGNKRQRNDNIQRMNDYSSPAIRNCSFMGHFASPYSGPSNPNGSPTCTRQFQMKHAQGPGTDVTPLPKSAFHSWRSPIEMVSPFSGHKETPHGILGIWNQSGSMPVYGLPRNYSRGGFPRHGRRTGSYSRKIRHHSFSSSPAQHLWPSSGRGRGFHAAVSVEEQPELFFHKSMVEDPWKFLKPIVSSSAVVMKEPKVATGLSSWLPKTITVKKAKVSEAAIKFNFQSSLSDCLTLSIEEARNGAINS